MTDPAVSAYVSGVVHDFAYGRRAYRVAPFDDEEFHVLADLAATVEHRAPSRRLVARVHLGNFALWLSGLFPERVAARQRRRGGPGVSYYDAMGRQGFAIAAAHPDLTVGDRSLYGAVREAFPVLRRALNHASDTQWFPHVQSPEKLLRQVSALWESAPRLGA